MKSSKIMEDVMEHKTVEEKIEINRAQIEHRATWMALIYEEVEKAGMNAEAIFRKAIHRCGNIHGERYRAMCDNPEDCRDFEKVFLNETGVKTFDMNGISSTESEVCTNFSYCALLSAWKKLGLSDEKCALLCDIAMDGDRGIAETMGLKLNLPCTIAGGADCCKLHFTKL